MIRAFLPPYNQLHGTAYALRRQAAPPEPDAICVDSDTGHGMGVEVVRLCRQQAEKEQHARWTLRKLLDKELRRRGHPAHALLLVKRGLALPDARALVPQIADWLLSPGDMSRPERRFACPNGCAVTVRREGVGTAGPTEAVDWLETAMRRVLRSKVRRSWLYQCGGPLVLVLWSRFDLWSRDESDAALRPCVGILAATRFHEVWIRAGDLTPVRLWSCDHAQAH